MGLKDWIVGKVENKVAQRFDTPEEVQAMLDAAPPLPKPPLGWGDWIGHTVLGSALSAGAAAATHALADGFQPSDLWAVAGAGISGAAGALTRAEWAKSSKLLTIGLGGLAAALTLMAQSAVEGHLTEHDLATAVINGVAYAANAFQKRPDEK